MSNQQLKQKIANVWKSLKGLKAQQIQTKIQISKQLAESIVGIGELDKIRNSTLLRLLSYELIAFADDKMNSDKMQTTYFSSQNGRNHNNVETSAANIRQLKQMLQDIAEKGQTSDNYLTLDRFQLNSIMRKVHDIEEEFRQESIKRKFENIRAEDPEGMEAMIEQLQILLKKKEARIKELNSELEQNFNDKEQLQMEIQALEQRNYQLEQSVKSLEDQCNLVKDQFEKYKSFQKQELLFGASEFMNGGFPHKQVDSPLPEQAKTNIPADMLTSTQVLSRYCSRPELKVSGLEVPAIASETDIRTVKKPLFKPTEEEYVEEQNLLESMRIYRKESDKKLPSNEDSEMLSRMLLMQASFIEQVMVKILD